MGRVPFIDTTGLRSLEEIVADFQRTGTRVVLCELRPNVRGKLERAGITTSLGPNNVIDRLADL